MKRIIMSAIVILCFNCCKKENKISVTREMEGNREKSKIDSDSMLNLILKKQIEKGISGLLDNSFDIETYVFSKEDLEVTLPLLKNILIQNGYKVLSNKKFNEKINEIFGRKISSASDRGYLFSNDYNICSKSISFYRNDNSIDIKPFGFYIIKNENYITELYAIPEIINYQKENSSISQIEESMNTEYTNDKGLKIQITRWKDISDLAEQRKKNIQTLVARNMYLFNDNRAYFKWLLLNDENFMKILVTTFGYYDDKELVKWMVNKTQFTNQNIEEANKIIYSKKCDGKIVFNQQLLNVLAEDEVKATQFYDLVEYNNYTDWLLSNKSNIEPTFSQKAEIIARIHSFIYSHAKDYRIENFMGRFAEYNDSDNKYSKEFKLKNYYNIPEFEKQWKQAKIDGDGISLPGEE